MSRSSAAALLPTLMETCHFTPADYLAYSLNRSSRKHVSDKQWERREKFLTGEYFVLPGRIQPQIQLHTQGALTRRGILFTRPASLQQIYLADCAFGSLGNQGNIKCTKFASSAVWSLWVFSRRHGVGGPLINAVQRAVLIKSTRSVTCISVLVLKNNGRAL